MTLVASECVLSPWQMHVPLNIDSSLHRLQEAMALAASVCNTIMSAVMSLHGIRHMTNMLTHATPCFCAAADQCKTRRPHSRKQTGAGQDQSGACLINGLVCTGVSQLPWAVSCEENQGDVALAGFHHCRQKVGNRCARRSDHYRRHPASAPHIIALHPSPALEHAGPVHKKKHAAEYSSGTGVCCSIVQGMMPLARVQKGGTPNRWAPLH